MYSQFIPLPVVVACFCLASHPVAMAFSQENQENPGTGSDAVKITESGVPPTESDKQAESGEHSESGKQEDTDAAVTSVVEGPTATGSTTGGSPLEQKFQVIAPEWYSEEKTADAQGHVYPFSVFGLDTEQLESEKKSLLREKVNQYLDELLGLEARHYVVFSDQEIQAQVVREATREGTYFNGSDHQPVEVYFADLQFSLPFETRAKKRWIEERQRSRLVQYGLVIGGLLLAIGFVFGGIRLNSATSGFYQGRLQFVVGIVILGIVVAGVFFGSQIDWI